MTSTAGSVYVIKTREFINANRCVIKVGHTSDLERRMQAYPKRSKCILAVPVPDSKHCEGLLLQMLRSTTHLCRHAREFGLEWFEAYSPYHESYVISICLELIRSCYTMRPTMQPAANDTSSETSETSETAEAVETAEAAETSESNGDGDDADADVS